MDFDTFKGPLPVYTIDFGPFDPKSENLANLRITCTEPFLVDNFHL